MPSSPTPASAKPLSAPQKALIKLGLKRDIDLALHLPLRYEDETRIVKLSDKDLSVGNRIRTRGPNQSPLLSGIWVIRSWGSNP
jgi:RecG-like helicase